MVPLDHETLTNLRKHLPPDKSYGKNVRGESVMFLSVTAGTPCPGGLQTVDNPTVCHCSVDLSTDQTVLIPKNQSDEGQPSIATASSGRQP